MSQNPFAPPVNQSPHPEGGDGDASGFWREGSYLVIRKDADPLPHRCVKCNAPAQARNIRQVQWYPRWITLTVIVCWPAFLIGYLLTRKTAKPNVGLCMRHAKRTKMLLFLGRVFLVVSLVGLTVGIFSDSLWFLLSGTVGLLISLAPLILAIVLRPVHIDNERGKYKGAGPAFLDTLEEMPPGDEPLATH
jgi:hypothetical protein